MKSKLASENSSTTNLATKLKLKPRDKQSHSPNSHSPKLKAEGLDKSKVEQLLKRKMKEKAKKKKSKSKSRSRSSSSSSSYETEDEQQSLRKSNVDFRKNLPMSYLSCETTDKLLNHLLKHHVQQYQNFHKTPHSEIQKRIQAIKQKYGNRAAKARKPANSPERAAQQKRRAVEYQRKLDEQARNLQFLKPKVARKSSNSPDKSKQIPDYKNLHHKLHRNHFPNF